MTTETRTTPVYSLFVAAKEVGERPAAAAAEAYVATLKQGEPQMLPAYYQIGEVKGSGVQRGVISRVAKQERGFKMGYVFFGDAWWGCALK